MTLYKWTSNKDSLDNTEEIRLEGREPVRRGSEVELSDEEYESLKGQLNLRKVSDDETGDSEQESGEPQAEGKASAGESRLASK
jgi:hypothetical protein